MDGQGENRDGDPGPDSGEELDVELRRLFSDDRLDVAPTSDAGQRIIAGARRLRRRRRALVSGAATFVVAGLVAGGVLLGELGKPEGNSDVQIAAPPAGDRAAASQPAPPTILDRPQGEGRAGRSPEAEPRTETERTVAGSEPASTPTTVPPARGTVMMAEPALRHDGYKDLRLGMRYEQAVATGMLTSDAQPPPPDGSCMRYALAEGAYAIEDVVISAEHGVVAFNASKARTTEGVGAGSSERQVRAAYDDLTVETDGYSVAVGNARYHLAVSQGSVMRLRLLAQPWPC
ncbi:hypothetical protein FHU38_004923 [Saccharomonospora amisosensis]|uniref:Uncharacterized protein n=1 Tax=Saccharomonospora amisosensis TaxID=1128677 RepID=A0A7X5UUJ9_9PSEU|nr:hypothetical protein [Saccharomonospora amisosensis]NIJ14522.1 hypothetical protein [Saccharomonospora amisosensis]